MRGTTRYPARRAEIEAAGAEPVIGDPNVVGTLAGSLEHVAVACVLLGSAAGSPEHLAALHGSRLEMLLTRMVDSTVRCVVYEAEGSVDPAILGAGAALVRARCEDARIPYVLLRSDSTDRSAWTAAAVDAVNRALDGDQRGPR